MRLIVKIDRDSDPRQFAEHVSAFIGVSHTPEQRQRFQDGLVEVHHAIVKMTGKKPKWLVADTATGDCDCVMVINIEPYLDLD